MTVMKTLNEMEENKLRSILNSLKVTPDTIIDDSDVLLKYKGSVILSLDNITTLTGPRKSYKTAFKDLICEKLINNDDNFKGSFKGNILVVDTEQGRTHIKKSTLRMKKLLGEDADRITFFGVKPLGPKDRMKATEMMIENEGPTVVIIDGTRDFMNNINCQEETSYVINTLLRWAYKYKISIINIIHTNPKSETTRGSIGTELENKSETVIHISRNGSDVAYVKPLCTRDLEFDPFNLYLENNIPVYKEIKNKKKK